MSSDELDDTRTVRRLMNGLGDEDSRLRLWSVRALGKLGDAQAVPLIIDALNDKQAGVRRTAAIALGELGDPQAVPGLIQSLDDVDCDVREAAARALGQLGDGRALHRLAGFLLDPEPRQSISEGSSAQLALRQIVPGIDKWLHNEYPEDEYPEVSEGTVRSLVDNLKSPSFENRYRAAWALGTLGAATAVPGLIGALSDISPSVRSGAASSLGWLGVDRAVPHLISALSDEASVREEAAKALKRMGLLSDDLLEEGLSGIIGYLMGALDDSDNHVCTSAEKALQSLLSPEVALELVGAAGAAGFRGLVFLVKKLEQLGESRAVPALLDALNDANVNLRRAAAESLSGIANETAVPALVNALGDADGEVRDLCAFALAELGDRAAVPVLTELLGHAKLQHGYRAASALAKIGDSSVELLRFLSRSDSTSAVGIRETLNDTLGYFPRPDLHLKAELVGVAFDHSVILSGSLSNLGSGPAFDLALTLAESGRQERIVRILDAPLLLGGDTLDWELPFIPSVAGEVPYTWRIEYRDVTGAGEVTIEARVIVEDPHTTPRQVIYGDYLVQSVKQGNDSVGMVKADGSHKTFRYCFQCGEEWNLEFSPRFCPSCGVPQGPKPRAVVYGDHLEGSVKQGDGGVAMVKTGDNLAAIGPDVTAASPRVCPQCGEELNLEGPPQYCPYCRAILAP